MRPHGRFRKAASKPFGALRRLTRETRPLSTPPPGRSPPMTAISRLVPVPTRSELAELTDLHLLILGALWTAGEATIAEIHAAIRHRSDASSKTIATLLSRLEQRGFVVHHMVGREGVYRALVDRREALVARVGGLLGSFFAAEEDGVGAAAVHAGEVQQGDAERLRELLRRAERDLEER